VCRAAVAAAAAAVSLLLLLLLLPVLLLLLLLLLLHLAIHKRRRAWRNSQDARNVRRRGHASLLPLLLALALALALALLRLLHPTTTPMIHLRIPPPPCEPTTLT
jgi:1,4-dihydroxy-2-naphthoate octaprenyltransferase